MKILNIELEAALERIKELESERDELKMKTLSPDADKLVNDYTANYKKLEADIKAVELNYERLLDGSSLLEVIKENERLLKLFQKIRLEYDPQYGFADHYRINKIINEALKEHT